MTPLPNGTHPPADNSRPRLLIADDDLVVLATLGAQLTADFDVVGTARDGEQAIELARELQPEAALVDVQMPGGGGLRATRAISAACPNTALVILSVDESEESVVEFMNAGAITYLRKGMPATQIASRLHQSIAAHRAFVRA
ncbi:MAG TPA: response regulator transcription factor [Solirubrobacteraceae bacterium]|nr:response regulator transcription factor [Solirubrobacteraceae bacterium]